MFEEFIKSEQFEKYLINLQKKLKNKKVILYCSGQFLNQLINKYDLTKYFNIVGISDIRYENNPNEKHGLFRLIKPSSLKNEIFDCIIITSPNPKQIKNYLRNNLFINKKIYPIFEEKDNFLPKIPQAIEYFNQTKNILKTVKYLFFCSKEEINTKTNYEKKLKDIKNKLKLNKKIKILFTCEENQKWCSNNIYNSLKNNNNFEVLPVVLFPIITSNRIDFTQKENKIFFKKHNIETMDGYDYKNNKNFNLQQFDPDIVFYQQPWYLENENHPINVSKYALTAMLPYGYTTLNEKFWGSDSVKKVYSNLWMFFSESNYHNKFYKKAANMKYKDNLIATGTPKLDSYNEPINKDFERLWKNGKNRIIWAPHHSIKNQGLCMSNFEECYEFMLDFAKNHSEYTFILKPHPALKSTVISTNLMTEKDFESYLNEWKNLPNTNLYEEGMYFDIFKTSDLLITDCSSFLAEYFPTQKPIILQDRKNRAPFDNFGRKLEKGIYKVSSTYELPNLIRELLINKKDILKNTRQNIIEKNFYIPKPSSSELIVDFLQKTII